MGDFERDNGWQRTVRDTILAPHFYGRYAVEGRYVFVDKGRLAKALQRRAVDTIIQGRDGAIVCIEEKIVRWPGYVYTAFCLETQSCTKPGYESDGWMHYGAADYLLYCFQMQDGTLDCHVIPFQTLKKWFWPLEHRFPTFGPLQTLNRTAGRVVPIEAVRANVSPYWQRLIGPAAAGTAA